MTHGRSKMKMNSNAALSQLRCLLVLCATLWGAVAVAQQPVARPDYVVSMPVINMYSAANADSDVVSQALYGSGVLSIEKKNGRLRPGGGRRLIAPAARQYQAAGQDRSHPDFFHFPVTLLDLTCRRRRCRANALILPA